MARRVFNPIELYVGFVERKSKNGVVVYGNLDSPGEKIITSDRLTPMINAQILPDVLYTASISREITTNNYNIRRVYDYDANTKVTFSISNMSKPDEAQAVCLELDAFYKKIGLKFNAKEGLKLLVEAAESNKALFINNFIPFGFVGDIVNQIKINPASYFLEIVSDSEAKSMDSITLPKSVVEDWTPVFVPEQAENIDVGSYIMPDSLNFFLTYILPNIIERQESLVLGFVGNSGNGKTAAGEAMAKYLTAQYKREFKFVKINVPAIMRPTDFFLQSRMKGGDTFDEYTKFYNALTTGNSVILLDEANRVTADNINILLGLVDGSESFFIKGADHPIAKNNIVLFSYNEGYQYTGTFDMDRAIKSRMNARIDFELPSKDTIRTIILKYRPDMPIEELNGFIWLLTQLVNGTKANSITVDASIRSIKNWVMLYSSANYNRKLLSRIFEFAVINFAETPEEKVTISELVKKMIIDFQLK